MSCYEPCPACNRHVVTDETTCPFCAAPLPDCIREVKRKPLKGRMSRAGVFAAGAAATLISACSASHYGTAMIIDAGPMPDATAGADTADGQGGVPDGPVALYGAPAPAASTDPAAAPADTPPKES